MSETSLSVLVKEVGEALMLDNSNHEKEAYKKYVSCIYKIATNLILAMKQAGGDVVVDSKTCKQVKLAQQCVERVSSLLEKMNTSKSQSVTSTVMFAATVPTSDHSIPPSSNHGIGSLSGTPAVGRHTHDSQTSPTSLSPGQPPATYKHQPLSPVAQSDHSSQVSPVPSLMSETNPHAYSVYKSRALTPMEIAKRQNQSLMVAYKARMKRLNRSDFNAFNYSLTIQRKMAENIAIAQAQEEELARKMQARNQRLEEEAAKRFATPMGMSKEEQEQRQIYKKILEYENEAKWLKNWRSKLESNPEDPILINQLVQEILRCSDHPFTELLHKYQFNIYRKLYALVANKHHEIDMVKIPLPECAWPSKDDVADVLGDGLHLLSSPEDTRAGVDKDSKKNTLESKTRKDDTEKKDGSDTVRTKSDAESTDSCPAEGESQATDAQEERKNEALTYSDAEISKRRVDNTESENVDPETWDDPLCVRSKSNTSLKDESHSSIHEHEQTAEVCHEAEDASSERKDLVSNERKDSGELSVCDSDMRGKMLIGPESSPGRSTENADSVKNKIAGSVHVLVEDSCETGSDDEGHSEATHESVMAKTRNDVHLAVDKGKELESQLSWERRQAQILMRQVTKDYSSYKLGQSDYDENNLDYLFDDDDDDDDDLYSWFNNSSIKPGQQNSSSPKTTFPQESESTESSSQGQSPNLDRSISETVTAVRSLSENDDANQFQSLPVSLNQDKAQEDKEFARLSQDAYRRHLKSISEDIHRYLEKLLVMMTIAYEPLDTPVGKDQCAVSMEEPFFKPIWKTLLRLFRVVNYKQELVLACVMTRYADATLDDFKVSKKLWLTDTDANKQPYQTAITELANVKEHYTMLNKLDCIVKVCRLICQCVDDYYMTRVNESHRAGRKAPSIGADDLLPILCYVVVKSAMPQLGTECLAMTEFIHEGYMMGEEGYCLTTLRTALNYVVSMFSLVTKPC